MQRRLRTHCTRGTGAGGLAGVLNDRVEYVRDAEDLIYEAFQASPYSR